MVKWQSLALLAAFISSAPADADRPGPNQMLDVIDSEAANIGMRFTLLGTRNADRQYWEIDINGKGEIGIPATFESDVMTSSDSGISFQFDEGVHAFDIGPDGYSALRQIFANLMSGDVHASMVVKTDYECHLKADDDLPAMKLTWLEDRESRTFALDPTACMSAEERAVQQQFDSAWKLIGTRMLATSQSGVTRRSEGETKIGEHEGSDQKVPPLSPLFAWVPNANDMTLYYPRKAFLDSISGRVTMDCAASDGHRLDDCRVVAETPQGQGFGMAALRLSTKYQLVPQQEGEPSRLGMRYKIVLKFSTAD